VIAVRAVAASVGGDQVVDASIRGPIVSPARVSEANDWIAWRISVCPATAVLLADRGRRSGNSRRSGHQSSITFSAVTHGRAPSDVTTAMPQREAANRSELALDRRTAPKPISAAANSSVASGSGMGRISSILPV